MTKFEITSALKQVIENSELPSDSIEKLLSSKYISHENLILFYKDYQPTATLIDFIKLSNLHTPNVNTRNDSVPKTKEFIESMKKLRLKYKEEEYQRMVNPNPIYDTLYDNMFVEPLSPAQAHKELKNQITTIINIMISVGSVVYAVWYWTDSSMKMQDSYRVLLCLFFGILILVAEVVVYLGYLNKIEEAKIKERKKVEIKKLVKTID